MKVWQLTDKGLVEGEAPEPQPGPGEILIQVKAAGVTPTELIWYPTTHTKSDDQRLRAVPGHEFSGVVTRLGDGAEGVTVNREVYGMNDWFAEGAMAEYCVTLASSVALKPEKFVRLRKLKASNWNFSRTLSR